MNQTLFRLAILGALVLTLALSRDSIAGYGGDSAGYQQENREDDYYYGGCYNNACAGRCGPGCSTYFGTTVTQACINHDNCIRDYKCAGYSGASAHYYCLSGSRGLGKAAASLGSFHWNNWKTYVKDSWQSTWATVGW
ncbi:MAG: hypothetical protein H0T46_17455 [Deltaproteobacteria bacterium]|nr:hypothetical protein [Deltaproteobacteria bacterium]